MSNLHIVKTESTKLQSRIYNVIKVLAGLNKTTIIRKEIVDYSRFTIEHPQAYVPDFDFEWCDSKKHYRVYIHQAFTNEAKRRRGYCIAVINGPLAATEFVQMYKFLHKHRANNKDSMQEAA